MSMDDVEYGIALPAHRIYVRMVEDLPDYARKFIHLHFFLVHPGNDARDPEVRCFPFTAR